MIATTKNRLFSSEAYPIIMEEWNKKIQVNPKYSKKKFYEDFVSKKIPSYSQRAWYQFLTNFETEAGLPALQDVRIQELRPDAATSGATRTLLKNEEATAKGMTAAINTGALFYERLWTKYNNNEPMTKFEESCMKDLLLKGMKAQDSRIAAIGKVREDNREEEKMQRAFDSGAY